MIRAAVLAALISAPAHAGPDDAEFCAGLAGIVYNGAIDGLKMAPLVDGIEEALTGAGVYDVEGERMVVGSYLSGYSSGLGYLDPAERAQAFYDACVLGGV